MLITRFEALGLLPDREEFIVYYATGRDRRKRLFSLDGILEALNCDLYMIGKIENIRRGVLVMSHGGQIQIPVDRKKVQRFIKANGGKVNAYDFAHLEGKVRCPVCETMINDRGIGEVTCPKCGTELEDDV